MPEHRNPLNRLLTAIYRPTIRGVLAFPKTVLLLALVALGIGLWPATKLGSEFMPALDEGDLMYMSTTYAGISIGKARELLRRQGTGSDNPYERFISEFMEAHGPQSGRKRERGRGRGGPGFRRAGPPPAGGNFEPPKIDP